jgi:hypothetical protein
MRRAPGRKLARRARITVNARLRVGAANRNEPFSGGEDRMARAARKTGAELMLHNAGLAWRHPATARLRGGLTAAFGVALAASFATYDAADPSLNAASGHSPANVLGGSGAVLADAGVQSLGAAAGVDAQRVGTRGG